MAEKYNFLLSTERPRGWGFEKREYTVQLGAHAVVLPNEMSLELSIDLHTVDICDSSELGN